MLLSGGTDKNFTNLHGDSALAIATKANDKKCVQRLLSVNVRIICENKAWLLLDLFFLSLQLQNVQ